LWAVPPLVLVLGALALWMQARRRAAPTSAQPPLTADEQARLSRLMAGEVAADGNPSKTL
jgi:cytochrome c-type biogenesis protein CcmH/NrfF